MNTNKGSVVKQSGNDVEGYRPQKVLFQTNVRVILQYSVSDPKVLYHKAFKVIGIRPLAPVLNSVSLKLMQRKTLNFVINLPDIENITK